MDKEGFKHGDIFTAVPPTKKAIFIGKEDGKLDKYLEKDKVVFHFKGGEGYKSTYFNHVKAGGDVPNGAQWEELIIFEYNKLNKREVRCRGRVIRPHFGQHKCNIINCLWSESYRKAFY